MTFKELFSDFIEKNSFISTLVMKIQEITDPATQNNLIDATANLITSGIIFITLFYWRITLWSIIHNNIQIAEKIAHQLTETGPPLKFLVEYSKDQSNPLRAEKVIRIINELSTLSLILHDQS